MFDAVWSVISSGDLSIGEACHPYALRGSASLPSGECCNAFYFHFACWVAAKSALEDKPFTNFRVVLDIAGQPSPIIQVGGHPVWALFGRRADRNEFARWVKRYRTWFVDTPMENSLFPRLPVTGVYKLRFLPQSIDYDAAWAGYPPEAFYQWSAIIARCKSPVYVSSRSLAFVDDKEALLYKLSQ